MTLGSDLKRKAERAVATMNTPAAAPPEPRAGTRPITSLGNMALVQPTIDALNERAKEAERRATEAQTLAASLEQRLADHADQADLDSLVEVPGRRRKLTNEEFAELTENLRLNPLVTPVTVKRLADGRYEIVSGHNRVHAYRALGRTSISIVIAGLEDNEVDRAAFYANLLQPSLPDFAKYIGFSQERDRHEPRLSQRELARAAGVDEKVVSRLFAFEELPVEALKLIETAPHVIGAACAGELARIAKSGARDRVVEAVTLLVDGKLSQKEAVTFAAKPPERKPARPAPVKIRAGRFDYCQYVSSGATLRIDFKDEGMRAAAEATLAEALKKLAESSSSNS